MSDEKYTRCPSCRTVFRVTPAQLELRSGQVRCGHCHTVFDGFAQAIPLAPRPEFDNERVVDDATAGPPMATLRSAPALEPSPESAPKPEHSAPLLPPEVAPDASPDAPDEPDEIFVPEARQPPAASRLRWAPLAYAVGVVALVLLLLAQAGFHLRDAIAVRWPAAAPLLTRACAVAGCIVGAPHEIADLAIVASDLQADPAHQGLLILTATVRNRSAAAVAYPYLELALTDAQDQIVVRRALAPGEYAGGTTDLARGIPANTDVTIKLFIDASATSQAGYRLYLFYA